MSLPEKEPWGGLVEHKIRQAQARGEFEGLPGQGRPLNLPPENPYEGSWRLAFKLLKDANLLPRWLHLDIEARELRGQARARLNSVMDRAGSASEFETETAALKQLVQQANRLITARNQAVPGALPPLALLPWPADPSPDREVTA